MDPRMREDDTERGMDPRVREDDGKYVVMSAPPSSQLPSRHSCPCLVIPAQAGIHPRFLLNR